MQGSPSSPPSSKIDSSSPKPLAPEVLRGIQPLNSHHIKRIYPRCPLGEVSTGSGIRLRLSRGAFESVRHLPRGGRLLRRAPHAAQRGQGSGGVFGGAGAGAASADPGGCGEGVVLVHQTHHGRTHFRTLHRPFSLPQVIPFFLCLKTIWIARLSTLLLLNLTPVVLVDRVARGSLEFGVRCR